MNTIMYALDHPGSMMGVIAPTHRALKTRTFEDPKNGLYSILPRELLADKSPYDRTYFVLRLFNGTIIKGFSAQKPEDLRGENMDAWLADEFAYYPYPEKVWFQLNETARIGEHRRIMITSTPNSNPILREIEALPETFTQTASTYDNPHLSKEARQFFIDQYTGTSRERQELYGEYIDHSGNLWTRKMIDDFRISPSDVPQLDIITVGVDPALTNDPEKSDEHGIVVAGKNLTTRHVYILEDCSLRGDPNQWAMKAIEAYHRYGASKMIVETNAGGQMALNTIAMLDESVKTKGVFATVDKRTRAEPASMIYQRGMAHHVGDNFKKMEEQMIHFHTAYKNNERSPDRMDALVYAIQGLGEEYKPEPVGGWFC